MSERKPRSQPATLPTGLTPNWPHPQPLSKGRGEWYALWGVCLLTCKLTNLQNHQLINLQAHQLISSPTYKIISSQTYKLTNSLAHKLTKSPSRQLTNSLSYQFINSETHQLENLNSYGIFYNAALIFTPF